MVYKQSLQTADSGDDSFPRSYARLVFLLLLFVSARMVANADPATPWWPGTTEQALAQAGTNRQALVTALEQTPEAHHAEMRFLIENAPVSDLQSLSADFLLQNLAQADDVFANSAWHEQIPPDIFLNEILPYACVNETRDGWRSLLRPLSAPLVADCQTPGEAARRINEKIFKLVKVHYSTERLKADQSPAESMVNGLASCTGLSILLVDACRSVGVPARLAGTPMWWDMRGNHTWVEVWDDGWHFVGASEPDPKGLDHAWFEHDASLAQENVPLHAIYAASFQKTDLSFPLDWSPDVHWISAVNVTERYLPKTNVVATGTVRLLVKVVDAVSGKRVVAKVTVDNMTNSEAHVEGMSKDESADMNNLLAFELPAEGVYQVCATLGNQTAEQVFIPNTNVEQLVVLSLQEFRPLGAREERRLKTALTNYFDAPVAKQADWKFSGRLEKQLRQNEPAVRQAAWEVYRDAPIHGELAADYAAKRVRFEDYVSPYTVKYVGQRPANGWALFIAMHGGGGAPKEVNDSQWKIMETHYKEHPEAGGYIYVALRAPNDTWNGFYDVYVYPLIANLVHQFTFFAGVDPDKVFIMGYSHGGYGAFAIGPKEPDLFAAVHASAAAPTEGETTPVTLRNTIFTCMVGGVDTAYGRLWRDKRFREEITQLRGGRTDIYPVTLTIAPGVEHPNLADHDKTREMYPAVRNPVPRDLKWLMTDNMITNFFWLHSDSPGKEQEIDAICRDNELTVTTTNVTNATVLLDSRLINFQQPVTLELNGMRYTQTFQPSLRVLCETMQRRGDPGLAFTAEWTLPLSSVK
jgi:pimeloyl-ACP methyl ester carboxylesterase